MLFRSSDLKTGAMFPTDYPAHAVPPFNQLGKAAREILCEADVILSLDWVDLGGALKQARSAGKVGAKIVGVSLDQMLHSGAGMEYQALPPMDVFMAASPDSVVADLLEALGPGTKAPWRERAPAKRKDASGDAVTLELIAATLRGQFNDPDKVSFACLNRGWPVDIPMQFAWSLVLAGGVVLAAGSVLFPNAQFRLVHHFAEQMGRFPTSHYGLIFTRAAAMVAELPLRNEKRFTCLP